HRGRDQRVSRSTGVRLPLDTSSGDQPADRRVAGTTLELGEGQVPYPGLRWLPGGGDAQVGGGLRRPSVSLRTTALGANPSCAHASRPAWRAGGVKGRSGKLSTRPLAALDDRGQPGVTPTR